MEARGTGTILVTSATAAVRGNAGQHSHAAAMGGRRMLCQTLNAEYASKGIHVAHIIVDGAVDAPDTLEKCWVLRCSRNSARPAEKKMGFYCHVKWQRPTSTSLINTDQLDTRARFEGILRSSLVEPRALI